MYKLRDLDLHCSISYVLGRRRDCLRRHLRGHPRAATALDELAKALIQHFAMSGWGVVGVNSEEAAHVAIMKGLEGIDQAIKEDLVLKHHQIEDSGMSAARTISAAIQAAGGRVERVKPFAPAHFSPPRGLPIGTVGEPPPGWFDDVKEP